MPIDWSLLTPVSAPQIVAPTVYGAGTRGDDEIPLQDVIALAQRLMAGNGDHKLVGEALARGVLGEPFAEEGVRDTTAFKMAGELMAAFPYADIPTLAEHFRTSIEITGGIEFDTPSAASFTGKLRTHQGPKQEQHATLTEALAAVEAYGPLATPTAPALPQPFDAVRFGGELRDVASRCRKKDLKPFLEALCGGLPIKTEALPIVAAKLAIEFPQYAPEGLALGVQQSLQNSGIDLEGFAGLVQTAKDAQPKIDRTQAWAQGLACNDDGKALPSLINVLRILREHPKMQGSLGFDLLRQNVVFGTGDHVQVWTDQQTTQIRGWIISEIHAEVKRADVQEAVNLVARGNSWHPVQVYLNGLAWDGVPRIDTWLSTYCAAEDSPYTRAVGAKWLISAVARAMQPGCKVDTMLILQGAQGLKKSTAFATLVPDSAWFADSPLDFDRPERAALSLFGKWIYEIGELQGFAKADANRLKGFMSSRSDNVRAPYASRNEEFPRGCVFGGTTNADNYLTDETGNRRYWPVSVGACDVGTLARDRNQIWAEAVARYRADEAWWLDATTEALAKVEQDARYLSDVWEESIRAWLANPSKTFDVATGKPFDASNGVTTGEVLSYALDVPVGQHDRARATRVGQTLRRLGYTPRGTARRYQR